MEPSPSIPGTYPAAHIPQSPNNASEEPASGIALDADPKIVLSFPLRDNESINHSLNVSELLNAAIDQILAYLLGQLQPQKAKVFGTALILKLPVPKIARLPRWIDNLSRPVSNKLDRVAIGSGLQAAVTSTSAISHR